jgi:hypothetical protein
VETLLFVVRVVLAYPRDGSHGSRRGVAERRVSAWLLPWAFRPGRKSSNITGDLPAERAATFITTHDHAATLPRAGDAKPAPSARPRNAHLLARGGDARCASTRRSLPDRRPDPPPPPAVSG